MKIESLFQEHKYFALAERGMTAKSFQEIWRILRDLQNKSAITSLNEATTQVIQHYLRCGRLDRGWSPKTFHTYRQYLFSFFEWCCLNGHLSKNPVKPIGKPALEKRLPRYLTREDARKVLFHASWHDWKFEFQKIRNPTILATFLMTGIRLQELINLKLSDVSLLQNEISVLLGKGRKDRIVPIHERLLPILRKYIKERLQLGKKGDCFFPTVFSEKRLTPRDVRAICRRVGTDAGVKFTPHMLRHTFGREMIENDFPIYKLKEIMGHSNVSTTQIYLSVSRESVKRSFGIVRLY